jgi:S-(hydroxymethyl)glutathione dehydrogenase / alcohol dehydrogenase
MRVMRAAVLRNIGDPTLDIVDTIETIDVGPGQVRVRVRATGLCHSDLSAMTGVLRCPAPFVPGHEGAGEVLEVGEGVTKVAPGDHIMFSFVPSCGECADCRRGEGNLCAALFRSVMTTPNFRLDGDDVFSMTGCGTFAEETVVAAQSVIPIPADVPFDIAALLGCGVTTGTGAVLHTAQVKPGSTVAIVGCGGVGTAAMLAARLAGAAQILAVDPSPAKRDLVAGYGATAAASPEDAAEVAARLTDGQGFDYAFEVVGRASTARAAYDLARRGGTVVVVGVGTADDKIQVSMNEVPAGSKKLMGSFYGGTDVPRQIETLIALWRAGRLDLESMITGRLGLDDINKGFDVMRTGDALRTVVEL